jgi:hypothetical protein
MLIRANLSYNSQNTSRDIVTADTIFIETQTADELKQTIIELDEFYKTRN